MTSTSTKPYVVCLSGSLTPGSRTELLATWCTSRMTELGAEVTLFAGSDLDLPHYRPTSAARVEPVRRMLDALRVSDGVVLVSPTYHGTISGVFKNALDYVNDLGAEPKPFLDGRPVGCLAIAAGDQGASSTLATLRTVVHALRGWPTPLGVTAWGTSADVVEGAPADGGVAARIEVMLAQVLSLSAQNSRRRRRLQGLAAG